jgi:uncharacterized protein YcbX
MTYQVQELYIYPIKSLAGITVFQAVAQEMGFENDRRWMLIDEKNQFITQRNHPVLSQFYPKINLDTIQIDYDGSSHDFLIDETVGAAIFSTVWDDATMVYEVNTSTSKWFSTMLGFGCKLVKIIKNGDRKHDSSKLGESINVSLADGYPYLLVGSKSLDVLNAKLEDKITISRFRPNIVIGTTVAHEEDTFGNFQIADVQFQNVKPCGRCVMVNTNPATAIVKKEPLKTLSTYRKVDNAILFGTNTRCLNEGKISIGDSLTF